MISGSLVGVLALAVVATAPNFPVYFAAWLLAGTAQAAVLYQPAFTVISRWYGPARIRALTVLTLVAGFASTIFAPITAGLSSAFGWRGAIMILAGIMGLITVPLHARYLNRDWAPAVPGGPATDRRMMVQADACQGCLGQTGGVSGIRWVLHVDLDQFIAAVEVLRRPELAGKPIIVGGRGDPTERAVVSTASYEARAFGVGSGMPLRIAARKVPDAVILPVDQGSGRA